MLRIRNDDPEAFGELYDRYVSLAFKVANSVCRDVSLAEEAVQEGFLSIWRGRARYRPDSGSVKGWALSIVRNRAIDSVRRDVTNRHPARVEQAAPVPDTKSESPPDAVIARNEGEALRGFMNRLPDTQAEVITLAYFGGLTHTEIAKHLSLPEGTVKGRMRLGMHKLRADMDERDAPAPANGALERASPVQVPGGKLARGPAERSGDARARPRPTWPAR